MVTAVDNHHHLLLLAASATAQPPSDVSSFQCIKGVHWHQACSGPCCAWYCVVHNSHPLWPCSTTMFAGTGLTCTLAHTTQPYAPTLTLVWCSWPGFLAGRKATAHPAFSDKLTDGSAVSSRVVVDGPLTTSRGPGTAFEFALALVKQLYGEEKMREVAGPMVRVIAGHTSRTQPHRLEFLLPRLHHPKPTITVVRWQHC